MNELNLITEAHPKIRTILMSKAFMILVFCLCSMMYFGQDAHAKVVDSGKCGDNVVYELDDEGTLTISGSGDMINYAYGNSIFYDNYDIKSIIISSGVTSIGDYAFFGCSGLTSINMPGSVTSIGMYAFYDCSGLTSINIPGSVTSIGRYAFEGCSGLTSVTISEGVTRIGDGAFIGCSGLTSVNIPGSATSTGSYAFEGCSGLTSITISEGVTSIGAYAFEDCSGLTSVNIPESVTSIDMSAFEGCSGLTSITIPEGVTIIESSAFSGCSGLTSVNIPKSVTSIGWRAFEDCSGLTSVNIPGSVTSIWEYAFSGCSGLTSVNIPDSVTSIGSSAFDDVNNIEYRGTNSYGAKTINGYVDENGLVYKNADKKELTGCSTLKKGSITIPEGVTSIGDYAFRGCRGLTSITIPGSVTSIGRSAFYGCSGLISVNIPDSVTSIGDYAFEDVNNIEYRGTISYSYGAKTINGYVDENGLVYKNADKKELTGCSTQKKGSITIPEGVTRIVSYAFEGCSSVTSITIPESVTSIGDYAFSACSGLTSVIIPEGVTSIGKAAFYRCSGLTSITISEGVTSIGGYAFSDCSGLTSVIIPEGVTSIEYSAFRGCSGLTSVIIPEGVTSIDWDTFSGCSGLTSVIIPEGVTSIGQSAFFGCSGLTSITIPESVTSIEYSAFEGCSGLTSVIIPEGVTSIGSSAFRGCSSVTSITIPESVTRIGGAAFFGCSGLTSVNIPGSVTSIGDKAFIGCSGLTSITISEGVTSIGDSAFEDCSGITSVNIPGSVTSIGRYAFEDCSGLTSVTIPDSVTSIGDYAFKGCSGLKRIYCYASSRPLGWSEDWSYGCAAKVIWGYDGTPEPTETPYVPQATPTPTPTQVPNNAQDNVDSIYLSSSTLELGKTATCTAWVVFESGISNEDKKDQILNCEWKSEDESIVKIIKTDVLTTKVNNTEEPKFSTCTIKAMGIGTTKLTCTSPSGNITKTVDVKVVAAGSNSKEEYVISYDAGELSISSGKVKIGGVAYELAKDFTITEAEHFLDTGSGTVAVKLMDGKICKMESIENIVAPCVKVSFSPSDVVKYKEGKITTDYVTATALASVELKSEWSGVGLEKLVGTPAQDVSFDFKDITLKLDKELPMHMGKLIKSYSEKVNIDKTLTVANTGVQCNFENKIYFDKYTLNKPKDELKCSAVLTLENHEDVVGEGVIQVKNEEYSKNVSDSEELTKAIKEASNKNVTVSMSDIAELDRKQNAALKKAVVNWVGTIFALQEIINKPEKNITMLDELYKQLGIENSSQKKDLLGKIFSAACKGVGLNWGDISSVLSTDTKLVVDGTGYATVFQIYDEKGKVKMKVKVSFTYTNYNYMSETFAGSGDLKFEKTTGNNDIYRHDGLEVGYVTMTDLKAFSDAVTKVANEAIENVYKSTIGTYIDKVGDSVTEEIKDGTTALKWDKFSEATKKSFGTKIGEYLTESVAKIPNYGVEKGSGYIVEKVKDGVYSIYNPDTKSSKEHSIKCPVDVYVYDMQGNLKTAIVNNEIVKECDEILAYVIGDEKYVVTSGDNYTLNLVGNDEGVMNYQVTERIANNVCRTIKYNEVPLIRGINYQTVSYEGTGAGEEIYDLVYEMGDERLVYTYDELTVNDTENSLYGESEDEEGESPSVTEQPEEVLPTEEPIATPTEEPIATPTEAPTVTPTEVPTEAPTEAPTEVPTDKPTATPTEEPTEVPTAVPTATPAATSTVTPTVTPTAMPTEKPAKETVTPLATQAPTQATTTSADATITPPVSPSQKPSLLPSEQVKVPKVQKITVAKIKTYKAKNLKKKKVTFSLGAKTSGKGKLSYKNTTSKKLKKYISVSKKGKVTLKKGAKKGSYKITITASKTSKWKATKKVVKITVK